MADPTPTFFQTSEQIAKTKQDAESARISHQGQPGYDVFGDPVAGTPLATGGAGDAGTTETGAPTPTPPLRYTDTSSPFATGGVYANRTAPTPADEATIRENERKRVQASIDAINEAANKELAAVQARQTESLGRARALSSATGTLGSPTETLPIADITAKATTERQLVEKQKAADTQAILNNVEDRSNALIEKQKTEAKTNVETYNAFLKTTSEQALKDMTALATGQTELSYAQKQKLMQQTGYDEKTFDNLYTSIKIANAPKGTYINKDKPIIVGSKAIYFKQNPNGTISREVIDAGINLETEDVQLIIAPDGTPIIFNKKTGVAQIAPGFTEGQFAKPTTGTNKFGGAKLSSTQKDDIATMDTVKGLANDLIMTNAIGGGLPGAGTLGYGTISEYLSKVGLGTAEGQHVRDLMGNIKGTIAKLRGGTSFTPNEQMLLDTYTPLLNDADWKILQKLKDLNSFIDSKKKNTIEVAGGSMQNIGTDTGQSAPPGTYSAGDTVYVDGVAYTVGTDGDTLTPQ